MVDGKTGGLRAAPRINSVSSTIRLFNLRPLRTRFSPTFPPSYARCFLLRASRKRGYDNFMTVVTVVGALHKRQFKSSSPLKRPLPLAKPGGNLGISARKNARDNYWRDETRRGKRKIVRVVERKKKGGGKKIMEGERVKESAKGEGNEKQNAAMERNRRSAKASFPVHFLTTITFM